MSLVTDVARLYRQLPERSTRDERAGRRSLKLLFDEIAQPDYEWPKTARVDGGALWYLSRVLDGSTLRVYNEAVRQIQGTKEHRDNYKKLRQAPVNCGGFNLDTAILEDATPFEQMAALDHWMHRKSDGWGKGRRTICLRQGDEDYVPVYIASRIGVPATTMTVVLGSSRGKYKAPRYPDFAEEADLAEHSVFVKPLESLEIVRQPYFSAATVIKGTAFEGGVIDHRRRYETTDIHKEKRASQFACVELVGQNKRENSPIKEKSAGANLFSLLKKHGDEKMHPDVNYEDLAPEGYDDDAEIHVTPQDLWKAVKRSVCRDEKEPLDDLMRKLFLLKTGVPTAYVVKEYFADRVFN